MQADVVELILWDEVSFQPISRDGAAFGLTISAQLLL